MSSIDARERTPFRRERRLYVRAPRPIEFPSEEPLEEKVPETKRHLEARTTLYLLLKDALRDAAIGSEQFVYWDAGDPSKCLSPDVFIKLGAREETFDVWKIWQRTAPDLAVEIVSEADRRDVDWASKLARYQASGITEVARFDAANEDQPLRIWDRVDGELLERSPESTALRECIVLGLWWVIVPSTYGPMLRLARDREGQKLLPTASEERVRLEAELAEERKARSAEAHARLIAERERALAEQKLTAAQAEIEKLRAELELARARSEDR